MSDTAAIDETTLTHRVVLLGVADLAAADGTPAHAGEIRRVCREDLAAVEGDVLGTLTEAEIARALNELEAEGLVSAARGDTSATGKGRPRFELAVDRDTLLADLHGDERISSLVDARSD
jgi:predicted ArsR family transcriptional regulator